MHQISFKISVLILVICTIKLSYGIVYNCVEPGLVAITIDDGPNPANTQQVLDVFKEFNATATFFLIGLQNWEWNVTRYRETVTRAFNEGHQIGSHSYKHYDNLTDLSVEEIREELQSLHDLIYDIIDVNMTIFRPPHGYLSDRLVQVAEEDFGYEVILWNVDTLDWYHPDDIEASLQEYINVIDEGVDTSFIGLHHDFTSGAVELTRRTLELLTSRGLKVVTIDDCIKPGQNKL